jgi:hypothetical protein
MKKRNTLSNALSIRALLFRQGFGRTLDYLCTFSVFSVD